MSGERARTYTRVPERGVGPRESIARSVRLRWRYQTIETHSEQRLALLTRGQAGCTVRPALPLVVRVRAVARWKHTNL